MEIRLKYINQDSFYGSDCFIKRVGYEEKWDRVKRLGDTYYENELLERSVTEKYGSNLKIGKVDNTAAAIGTTGNGKLSIDEYVGHNLENVDKLKTVGASVGVSASGITSLGVNYSGIDHSEVEFERDIHSIGNEETFFLSLQTEEEIEREFYNLFEHTFSKLQKQNVFTQSVSIKIRYTSFKTYTKSKKIKFFTKDKHILYTTLLELLSSFEIKEDIRLLGIYFGDIKKNFLEQLALEKF